MKKLLLTVLCICTSMYIRSTMANNVDDVYRREKSFVSAIKAPKGGISVQFIPAGTGVKTDTIAVYKKTIKSKDCTLSVNKFPGYSSNGANQHIYDGFAGFSTISMWGSYVFFYAKGGYEAEQKLHYIIDTNTCKIVGEIPLPYFSSIDASFFWTRDGKQMIGLGHDEHAGFGYTPSAIFITQKGRIQKYTTIYIHEAIKLPVSKENGSIGDIHPYSLWVDRFNVNVDKKRAFVQYSLSKEIGTDKQGNPITHESTGSVLIDLKKFL